MKAKLEFVQECVMISRICLVAGMPAILVFSFAFASAQTVRFDAPGFIEGREVSSPEFQSLHPSEKLVEFSWEIAADLGDAGRDTVTALWLRLHTAEPDATIFDYCPRTLLDSEIDGTIQVSRSDESNASLGLQGGSGSSFPWPASASAGIGGKNSQSVKFEQRPEQRLLISSGLMDRGTGLFIRIHKSPQNPLDGMRPIRLVLRVPQNWRTGFLRLDCEAIGRKESRLADGSLVSVSKRSFLLPLLIEGDEEARIRARAIQKAETALRAAVDTRSDRAKADNLLGILAEWSRSEKTPRLDSAWLDRIVEASPSRSTATPKELPRDVAIALKDYVRLKQSFVAPAKSTSVESVAAQSEHRAAQRSN